MKPLLMIAFMAIATLILAVGYDLTHETTYDLSHREDMVKTVPAQTASDHGLGITWNYATKRGF